MADDRSIPHPPAEARQPTTDVEQGIPFHNTDEAANHANAGRASWNTPETDEPTVEDLGPRDFAGQNFANDPYKHPEGRDPGLGGGSAAARDAYHPAQGEGEVPEDDMD